MQKKKVEIHFYPEEEIQLNEFLEKIKKFGKIKKNLIIDLNLKKRIIIM